MISGAGTATISCWPVCCASDLQRELAGAEVAALHRRAMRWFEQAGLLAEAIQHALAAGDFAHAADLIEHSALPMALEGQQATVAGWLAALPEALRHERPRLVLAQAGIDGSNGDFAAAAAQLQQAERWFTARRRWRRPLPRARSRRCGRWRSA